MPAPVICTLMLPFFDQYNGWWWFPAKTATDGANLAGEILAREATAPTDVWIFFNLRETAACPAGGAFALSLMTTFPYIYRPQENPAAGVTFYNGCAIFSKYPLSQTASIMDASIPWNTDPGVQNLRTLGIFALVTQAGSTYAVAGMDTLSCLHPNNVDFSLDNPTTDRYALTSPAIDLIRGNLASGWYHTFLAVNPGTYRTASGWTAWFMKSINQGPKVGTTITPVSPGSPYFFY